MFPGSAEERDGILCPFVDVSPSQIDKSIYVFKKT